MTTIADFAPSREPSPTLSRPGYAQVHKDDHPVFSGQVGGTTLRAYTRLARWARTSNPTAARPRGHVIGGEARLGKALGITDKTARVHLRRLLDAGLLVVWSPPNRGAGLATEYLVVHLATPGSVAVAATRDAERSKAVAWRQARTTGSVEHGPDGRYRRSSGESRSDRALTGNPAPVTTGSGLPSDETLTYETQVKARDAFSVERATSTALPNQAAYLALAYAEQTLGAPQRMNRGERAGLAKHLTWKLGAEDDLNELARDLIFQINEEGSSILLAAGQVLGVEHIDYYPDIAS
jgi:hypothetical protein